MKISQVTGKSYNETEAIYMTNPKQHFAYARYFGGWDYFLDMLFTSDRIEGACVFVWKKCDATRQAKLLWDQHEL
jgi:hypothetical protein